MYHILFMKIFCSWLNCHDELLLRCQDTRKLCIVKYSLDISLHDKCTFPRCTTSPCDNVFPWNFESEGDMSIKCVTQGKRLRDKCGRHNFPLKVSEFSKNGGISTSTMFHREPGAQDGIASRLYFCPLRHSCILSLSWQLYVTAAYPRQTSITAVFLLHTTSAR